MSRLPIDDKLIEDLANEVVEQAEYLLKEFPEDYTEHDAYHSTIVVVTDDAPETHPNAVDDWGSVSDDSLYEELNKTLAARDDTPDVFSTANQ